MKKSIIIILAVVAILVIWAVSVYNGLVTMDENVTRSMGKCRNSIPTSRRPDTQSCKHRKRICFT